LQYPKLLPTGTSQIKRAGYFERGIELRVRLEARFQRILSLFLALQEVGWWRIEPRQKSSPANERTSGTGFSN